MYILLLSSLAYYPVLFAFESWYVTIVSCTTTLVINFVWFVGMHVRTQNLHSLFPIPTSTVKSVRSQVMDFSFSNLTATKVLPGQINEGVPNAALNTEN